MYVITNRDKILGTRYAKCKGNKVYFVEDIRETSIFETVESAKKIIDLIHQLFDIPYYQTAASMNIEEIKLEIVTEGL